MSWFLAFAGFAMLIILHEAGHFVAAKAVGMKVEKFYLFFPPKLAAVKRGETEYGIGAIPLGGFVKITGMTPDEEVPPEDAHRGYYAQPVWKRIVVIAAGPIVNVLIAFVILFLLAQSVDQPSRAVESVEPRSPAATVLEPGDELLAVDGVRGDFLDLREQIATHECAGDQQEDGCVATTPAQLTILRDGREITRSIRPEYDAELDRPLLGYVPGTEPLNLSLGESAERSGDFMWEVTTSTVGVIARIFDAEQREQISSVVGSYEVTRQAIEFDAERALLLLAVISLSLAIINLFPFLPLDGGHIFWSLVEKVRGTPVPFRVMERASVVGFVLVLMLFAVGLSNDIDRLTGDGFDVR
jgi:regulator of sigma E protease